MEIFKSLNFFFSLKAENSPPIFNITLLLFFYAFPGPILQILPTFATNIYITQTIQTEQYTFIFVTCLA